MSCNVYYEHVCSDHFVINCAIEFDSCEVGIDVTNVVESRLINPVLKVRWDRLSKANGNVYWQRVDYYLRKVAIPVCCSSIMEGHTFNACGCLKLADANHLKCVTFYYDSFKNAVIQAYSDCLPGAVQNDKQAFNQVAGWNDYVADSHKAARDAYSERHKVGGINRTSDNYNMCRTKRAFKVALRRCKEIVTEL